MKQHMVLVSAQGNPISQSERDGLPSVEVIAEISFDHVDMTNSDALKSAARNIAKQLTEYAQEDHLIVFPGSSTLALPVLTIITKKIGFFPRMAWASRNEDGEFVWSHDQTLDLNNL